MLEQEEIINKYKIELEEDTKVNMMNLKDVQMMLPSIKHKWVSRLIQHRLKLKKSQSLLKKAKEKLMEKANESSPIKLSKTASYNKIEENISVIKIRDIIEQEELIIEYLERVEKIFSSMTYDLKNLADIIKLETM